MRLVDAGDNPGAPGKPDAPQRSQELPLFAFPCWAWDLRPVNAKSHAQHANAHPGRGPVVSDWKPAPRPLRHSRHWFQIRRHRGKPHANGHYRFTGVFAATLLAVVMRGLPAMKHRSRWKRRQLKGDGLFPPRPRENRLRPHAASSRYPAQPPPHPTSIPPQAPPKHRRNSP